MRSCVATLGGVFHLFLKAVAASEGSLSALAVSDNGNFVAIGSMFDGTVEIYIAFNLKVRRVKCKYFKSIAQNLPTYAVWYLQYSN